MGKRKHIAIYLRVSSLDQNVKSQEPELKQWLRSNRKSRAVVWYRDKFSGATMNRPAMRKLEDAIAGGDVSTVLVWRLDRLGRTAHELLSWLKSLDRVGVEFVAVSEAFDTRKPEGRLLLTIMAGFVEYEREVIRQRVNAGIAVVLVPVATVFPVAAVASNRGTAFSSPWRTTESADAVVTNMFLLLLR